MTRYCINCKHFIKNTQGLSGDDIVKFGFCRKYPKEKENYHLIAPSIEREYNYANVARNDYPGNAAMCGTAGKDYEPKETTRGAP